MLSKRVPPENDGRSASLRAEILLCSSMTTTLRIWARIRLCLFQTISSCTRFRSRVRRNTVLGYVKEFTSTEVRCVVLVFLNCNISITAAISSSLCEPYSFTGPDGESSSGCRTRCRKRCSRSSSCNSRDKLNYSFVSATSSLLFVNSYFTGIVCSKQG